MNQEPNGIVEHQPSCGERCIATCKASPRHWPATSAARVDGGPLILQHGAVAVRVRHVAPVPPLARSPAPLWERVEDLEAVAHHRSVGCKIVGRGQQRTLVGLPLPLPETYVTYPRLDERCSLERWTQPGGIADRALDEMRAAVASERKVRSARDVAEIAGLLQRAFPGLGHRLARSSRNRKPSLRRAWQQALCELATGEPGRPARATGGRAGWDHLVGQGGIYVGIVWGLALLLFGRERDTVSEHALGRMLPGPPVRDQRAPFASAGHVLTTAGRGLPRLGAGSVSLEVAMPRARTRARWDECKVSPSHAGTERVRGEVAVHTVLDARAALRRAALTEDERAAVEVLTARGLTRDERVLRLRELEASRRGLSERAMVTEETARLLRQRDAIEAPDASGEIRVTEAKVAALHPLDEKIAARRDIDAAARPALLRRATQELSDAELLRTARAARERLEVSVSRTSREADRLVPERPAAPPRRRFPRDRQGPVYATLVAGDA